MEKEGELWDDSVLIKAFDDAMSKSKKMHMKKKTSDTSIDGQLLISDALHHQNHDALRLEEADENKNIVKNTETETREAKTLAPVEGNPCMDSQAPESYIDSSNGLATQDAPKGYSDSQGAEDYNQLLSQYYDLEEKRQHILQQLQLFGNCKYQFSAEGYSSVTQWGACSTSQEHPLPASQASHPAVTCSCCPYVCRTLVAPCSTYAACSLAGTCCGKICLDTNASEDSGKLPSPVKSNIVKTAMGAAEKAISSLKTTVTSNINEEMERKKENEGEMVQSLSSETDLTVVLNAWYSAGFYTGKYLTEQSIAKKQHD
ncbi:hypothetical protein Ddye_001232 [Dipteronia dyeriana]|uniref:Survival Motor Neuron Gemin2-binding domain-containing protein n=1 Tax=Dipteronia dyeriana TaxID=168575 RepID=A0AAD9XNR5_9ROSI|nr:hypothetical protein Ddye_001232 [Dipteronia dyeriana]